MAASASSATTAAVRRQMSKRHSGRFSLSVLEKDSRPTIQRISMEEGLAMEIMKHFDKEHIRRLKHDFNEMGGGDGVSLDQFVCIMQAHLPKGQTEEERRAIVGNLCEFFDEMDINGDQSLEWDEFVEFVVATGTSKTSGITADDANEEFRPSSITDLSSHKHSIERVEYFSKMDKLVALERGNVVKIYEPENCRLEAELTAHKGSVVCCEYIQSHRTLATASMDLSVNFWDANYNLTRRLRTSHTQYALRWADSSDILYSGDATGAIHAWNYDTLQARAHLHRHDKAVMDLCSVPSLGILVSASLDRAICVWDVVTWDIRNELEGHTKGVTSLAYMADYHLLFSAGFEHEISGWNPFIRSSIARLRGHPCSLVALRAVPNSPQLISADKEGTIKVWDVRTYGCMQTFTGPHGLQGLSSVCVVDAPNKDHMVVAATHKLTFFDHGDPPNPSVTDALPVTACLYNSIMNIFLTVAGKSAKMWDGRTGKLMRLYCDLTSADISAVCLDDRKRKFIVGDQSGEIKVFNFSNGAYMKSMDGHTSEITALVYMDDCKCVVSTSIGGDVIVHSELESERGILLKRYQTRPMPDGTRAHSGVARINMAQGRYQASTNGHTLCWPVTSVSYSGDIGRVVFSCLDGFVRLWDYERNILDCEVGGHTGEITCVQFLADHPAFVTADSTGCLRVWATQPSPAKYTCALAWGNGPGGVSTCSVTSVAFQGGTSLLACGDDRGDVRIWNLEKLLVKAGLESVAYLKLQTKTKFIAPALMNRKRAQSAHSLAAILSGTAKTSFADVALVGHWIAHDDVVLRMSFVEDPQSLITCSLDLTVSIWSLDGTKLGTLEQGNTTRLTTSVLLDGVRFEKWAFLFDESQRRRAEEDRISDVLKQAEAIREGQKHPQEPQPTSRASLLGPDGTEGALESALDAIQERARASTQGSSLESSGPGTPSTRRREGDPPEQPAGILKLPQLAPAGAAPSSTPSISALNDSMSEIDIAAIMKEPSRGINDFDVAIENASIETFFDRRSREFAPFFSRNVSKGRGQSGHTGRPSVPSVGGSGAGQRELRFAPNLPTNLMKAIEKARTVHGPNAGRITDVDRKRAMGKLEKMYGQILPDMDIRGRRGGGAGRGKGTVAVGEDD